jgi:hypothetical protein
MTKLSPSQRDLLARATDAPDGAVDAPQDAKAAIAALIKRGLMISIPQAEGPSRLTITEAGRAAIADGGGQDPSVKTLPEAPSARTAHTGKIAVLIGLLRQDGGANIEAMMAATGWQAHSVRGAISGAVKKKLGLTVLSEKTEAGRLYRIAPERAA